MSQFEIGKGYVAHDPCDWNKTMKFTVLRRNQKTLRIRMPDGEMTVPFCENAFGEGGELCQVNGYRLITSLQKAD